MNKQPEALRLAKALEQGKYLLSVERDATAAELRRLHAQRDALRAELKEATEAINDPAVNNLRTLAESIRMLSNQRDALLEALKRYVDHFGDPLKCARAAIKMAEEGK